MSRRQRKDRAAGPDPDPEAPARPRGRGPVRWGALAGVLGLVPLGLMLLTGDLSLLEAGERAGLVLAAALLLEAVVLPACRWLVGPPVRRGEDPPERR